MYEWSHLHRKQNIFLTHAGYNNIIDTLTSQDRLGDFECLCQQGYFSRHCELIIDYCLPQPCQNGANCSSILNNYLCTCPQDYAVCMQHECADNFLD